MTALKYWDSKANNNQGDWVSMTLTQQNNVKISTFPPTDFSQLWADPNDITYINAIDGGSA
jgi:hypothetical protein